MLVELQAERSLGPIWTQKEIGARMDALVERAIEVWRGQSVAATKSADGEPSFMRRSCRPNKKGPKSGKGTPSRGA